MRKFLFLGSVLSLGMVSAPADASYIFGSSGGEWTLTINGDNYSSLDEGWITSTGFHVSDNDNYIVGECCSNTYNNWAVFDLSNLTDAISSASLTLNTYSIGAAATYYLFDTRASLAELDQDRAVGDLGGQALFADLGSGTFYGSRDYLPADLGTDQTIALNSAALVDIGNAAGGMFAIGGTLNPISAAVPEPSTWAMMLLGFFGIGGLLRSQRRKQKITVSYT